MAMENEDFGELLQQSSHDEGGSSEDHGSFEPVSDAVPAYSAGRKAFSRRVQRTSKQPWYEPYLREIRRAH